MLCQPASPGGRGDKTLFLLPPGEGWDEGNRSFLIEITTEGKKSVLQSTDKRGNIMVLPRMDENREIISRYTDQPVQIPSDLRERIEKKWKGEPVQLYALADLDASMRLTHTWIALGPEQVAIAPEEKGCPAGAIRSFERSQVESVRENQD